MAPAIESEEAQPALQEEQSEVIRGYWRQVAKASAAAVGALGLVAMLALHSGSGSGLLRGPVDQSLEAVLLAAGKEPKQILEMAGRTWEFTDKADCWGHDLATVPVEVVWGSPKAVSEREKCARACLDRYLCVAFNYPNENFPDPRSPYDPQVCYLKYTHMYSRTVDMTCEKGFDTKIWHYYSLLDGDVWHRQSEGFRISEWPFRTKLPAIDPENFVWISGIRWEHGDGLKCAGKQLASYPVKASKPLQAEVEDCAGKCIANQDCIAFHIPKRGKDGDWVSDAQHAECRLVSGTTKTLDPSFDCTDGDKSAAWKSFTLADAWELKRNELNNFERKQRRPKWTGGLGNPCSPPPVGQWRLPQGEVTPEMQMMRKRRLESMPCCKWSLNQCGEDITETCTAIAGFPNECVGMCGLQTANCSCWSRKDATRDMEEDEKGCCTSCRYDCSGKQTCFPAGCAGAHKMCRSSVGKGSTCSCASGVEGATLQEKFVPADVAAGWSVKKHEWSA